MRAHEHAARHDQFGIEDIHQNRKPFPEIRARFAQNGDRVLVPLFRAFDDALGVYLGDKVRVAAETDGIAVIEAFRRVFLRDLADPRAAAKTFERARLVVADGAVFFQTHVPHFSRHVVGAAVQRAV